MYRRRIIFVAGWVAGAWLVGACSGTPSISSGDRENSSVTQGGKGSKDADSGGGDATNGELGTDFVGVGDTGECKSMCETGECGPISDGCGGVVTCGECTAPETCGGGGIPSRCGKPGDSSTCVPTTCEAIGATCGLQGDGCGGILDCWSDSAKSSGSSPACLGDNEQCVDGSCRSTVPECTKLACSDYEGDPKLCGPVSDGCSGVLDCGFTCENDESCINSECVRTCTPLSCEVARAALPEGFCDIVPDGCGGVIADCATACTGEDVCGGGGVAGVCGHGVSACVPKTAQDCGNTCGKMGDGCGGEVQCQTVCSDGEVCMGTPGKCTVLASSCTPTTCEQASATCGQISDGCDGFLTCGSCSSAEACGSNNQCTAVGCTPKTKEQVCTSGLCGVQSAGCNSEVVDCGGCPDGQTCGGGGPSLCGVTSVTCKPKTAAEVCAYSANSCGPQSDGCGGSVVCPHTCTWPERCTGNPTVCAVPNNPGCTNLCPYIDTSCTAAGKTPTQLTGKVYAPNGTVPLYNALVYVPNAALPSITVGKSCERCQDEDLGSPIAAARTGADGSFVLSNVPAGKSFPLVVKMGKWRRVVTIPAVTNCSTTQLTAEQTRLPKNTTDDADLANRQYLSIPRFAVVTGQVDAMECVLRRMGVADKEFTLSSETPSGRVHLYRGPASVVNNSWIGGGGVRRCKKYAAGSTTRCNSYADTDVVYTPLSELFSNSRLDNYDVAIFDCEGSAINHDAYDQALRAWADTGGRVFASHYSYTYLYHEDSFKLSATFGGSGTTSYSKEVGILDTSHSKGLAFNNWLGSVGGFSPAYGEGYTDITDPRFYVKSVNAGSERFVYTDTKLSVNSTPPASAVQQYAFNTPFKASEANICGRVLYSAFHVAGASKLADDVFPYYCSTGALTAQEKALMFMLFDLSSCVSAGEPPAPPTCTKNTCAALGATCGSMPDGCGGLLDCGTCTAPDTCGGGGTPNVCGSNCTRTTCGAQGANCGLIADGCGGILDCGTCATGTCGGSGTANVCGTPLCSPRTCEQASAECGYVSDGCGGILDCGTCTTGTCGGGGTPNVCASGTCTPSNNCGTAKCGYVSDGCGDTIECGTCPDGYSCVSGVCTGTSCTPRSCATAGVGCGFIGNGCGGVVDCGDCTQPGQSCGGGGVPSQCGGSCEQITCSEVNAECGDIGNGCGGITNCGICPPGQTCGAGGPNRCGAGSCAPRTCESVGANCGSIGDGCGGVIDCGECSIPGQSCGGAGIPNQCGAGGCIARTCEQQQTYCGPAADGCGGLLDCGTCPPGETCGGGGIQGRCGKTTLQ